MLSKEEISLFINVVKKVSTYDFSDYSERSFARRIDKILSDNKMEMSALITKVKSNPEFLERVVKDITVNTTELFRDPATWQALRFRVLNKFENQSVINIWHAGCSTGQEVYSMLILLNEMGLFEKANVFATDLNSDVLSIAKKGEYKYRFNIDYLDNFDKVINENPFNYEDQVSVAYSKYFQIDQTRDLLKMNDFLVNKPLFRKQDLINDGNIFYTKFDLILCRNVLIYFNHELQTRIFEMFHQNLFAKGYLVLGAHESMLGPVASKYVRKGLFYVKK
jgi:chemotaxis protein methyltransferase CheR